MINPAHIQDGIMYANYIIENRKTMRDTSLKFGVSSTKVSSRIALLKEADEQLYKQVKHITDELKLERVRITGKQNALRTGFRSRGNYNF